MTIDTFWALILVFLLSWQVKTLFGLIVLDVLLGIASALRRNVFDWALLATFYQRSVLPYLLGYFTFYLVIHFVIPSDSLGQIGAPITEGSVTLAWAVLVGTLGRSIAFNFRELYEGA